MTRRAPSTRSVPLRPTATVDRRRARQPRSRSRSAGRPDDLAPARRRQPPSAAAPRAIRGAHRHHGARRRFAEQRRDASVATADAGAAATWPGRSTVSPMPPVSNAHSASVTARPPSEQSCAERSSPAAARVGQQRDAARASRARSSRGGCPATRPCTRLQVLAAAELAVALAEQHDRRRPRPRNARATTRGRILDHADDADDRRRDRSPGRRSRCRG